jgi:ubiquinone/menaquinone biosynthesis C-methylase UbiE
VREIQRQFGRQAAQYSASLTHSSGESLDVVRRLVEPGPYQHGLDIATGAGFTAFAIAPYCRQALALDITPEMLSETRRLAAERGADGLGYVLGDAERLPFTGGSFDLITCRSSAHHFPNVAAFITEVARLLAVGGIFVLSDPVAPEDEGLTSLMNYLERLRDPTHVRDLTVSEWRRVIEAADLHTDAIEMSHTQHVFDEWVRRSGTTPEAIEELRPYFADPKPDIRAGFGIHSEPDGIHFAFDAAGIRARK